MKELYLHIGTGKTGTSALQKFLYINKEVLRKKGIYYPIMGYEQGLDKFSGFMGNVTGNKDIRSLGKDVKVYGVEELSCIEKIRNMFNGNDVVLLSGEDVWQWEIFKILSALSFFLRPEKVTVKIIVYLRRQDEYIESAWNQNVKGNPCVCEKCWEYTQKEMVAPKYDYNGLLSNISRVVGKENIACKVYDVEKYSDENTIYGEFMQIFGIDDISDFELPKFQVNRSMSKNMTEVRRIFNAISGSNILVPMVRTIIGRGGGCKARRENCQASIIFDI